MSRNFKRVISGGKQFLKPKKWAEWATGDFVEGVYENASELDLYGKPIYEIRVDIDKDTKLPRKKITGSDPTITTGDKSGIMPLYANGAIDFQMAEASYGDVVKIQYNGMAVTSKGKFKGKPCHSIEVWVDGLVAPDEEGDSLRVEDQDDSSLLG